LLAGNTAYNPTNFESIATFTVGAGGTTSVTISSIPQTYKHLQLRSLCGYSGVTWFSVHLNGDTANNYALHELRGDGSSATAYGTTPSGVIRIGLTGNSTSYSGAVTDILDYTSTTKNKTVRSFYGCDTNGGGYVGLTSGLWFKTPEAVTSLVINAGGGTINQYSQFALYGVK
jgi:hypothetical protein